MNRKEKEEIMNYIARAKALAAVVNLRVGLLMPTVGVSLRAAIENLGQAYSLFCELTAEDISTKL